MKKIIFLTVTFIISCKSNEMDQNNLSQFKEVNTNKTVIQNEKKILNNDFLEFVKKFKEKDLPFEIEFKNINWIDFNSDVELIEIDKISTIKYLLNGEKARLQQSDGGIRQFYYGYKINFPNKNIGLIYYRTDFEYIGFVMSLYDSNYSYLGEIFIAGSKGEYDIEVQKDVLIDSEGNISVTELKLDSLSIGKQNFKKYDSNLKVIDEKNNIEIKVYFDENLGRLNKS